MKSLLRLFPYQVYIYSLCHSIAFFVITLLSIKLYKLTSSLNIETIETFNDELIILTSLIFIIEIIHNLLYYISKTKINNTITNIFKKSINNLIDHKIYCIQNYEKERLYSLNDLIYIFDNVSEKIILNFPKNIIYLLYYLYELYNFSFKAIIVINIIGLISIYLLHYIAVLKESNYGKIYDTDIKIKNIYNEQLTNMKYIKCSMSEHIEKQNINNFYKNRLNLINRDLKLSNIIEGVQSLTGIIIIIIIYYIGSCDIKMGLLKPLDLVFIGSSSYKFIYYITDTKSIFYNYSKYNKQIELVLNIINNTDYLEENNKKTKKIYNIDQIDITYKSKDTFSIKPGEIITITGKNGLGKTTMIYSMLGLTDINSWKFKFYCNNNQKGEQLSYNIIRSCVAVVLQDSYLFNNTVWYNVTYNIHTNEDKIYDTAEIIGLKSWLDKNKYRNIGINGEYLSGGEKRKIQLLNALLHDKEIYIFDEPTNNLDQDVKNWYIDQIIKLSKIGKFIIIITNDDNIINKSDVKICLEKSMFK